jgi:hypothetical protein
MLKLSIKLDDAQVRQALQVVGRDASKAMSRAANKTATTVRAQAARSLGKEIALPSSVLKKSLPILPATQRHPEAAVVARGRPISIMRLGARQEKAGVSYRKGSGRELIKSAFIATMPRAGRPAVFLRTPPSERKSRGAWGLNLPIKKQMAPSVPSVVLEKGIFEALKSFARDTLAKNLKHELEYLLSQAFRK